jgi:undecaprenyl-diphosphatase
MRYAAAIICFLAFLALAAAVISGATFPFDMAVRAAVHGSSSSDLTGLAQLFSFIGSAPVWVTVTLIAVLLLWLAQRRKQALAMSISMTGAVLLDNGLKLLFHRARPEVFFGVSPDTYSFPSGHALFATCFYGTLAALLTAQFESTLLHIGIWGAAVLMTLCIGSSRVYLGVHFPTDVLAGYLAGASWLAALDSFGAFRLRGIIYAQRKGHDGIRKKAVPPSDRT